MTDSGITHLTRIMTDPSTTHFRDVEWEEMVDENREPLPKRPTVAQSESDFHGKSKTSSPEERKRSNISCAGNFEDIRSFLTKSLKKSRHDSVDLEDPEQAIIENRIFKLSFALLDALETAISREKQSLAIGHPLHAQDQSTDWYTKKIPARTPSDGPADSAGNDRAPWRLSIPRGALWTCVSLPSNQWSTVMLSQISTSACARVIILTP